MDQVAASASWNSHLNTRLSAVLDPSFCPDPNDPDDIALFGQQQQIPLLSLLQDFARGQGS